MEASYGQLMKCDFQTTKNSTTMATIFAAVDIILQNQTL